MDADADNHGDEGIAFSGVDTVSRGRTLFSQVQELTLPQVGEQYRCGICLQYLQLTIRKLVMHSGVPSLSMETVSGMEFR